MKKMFFLSNCYIDDNSIGITKKVLAQIETFNSNKINVVYFSGYVKDGVVIYDKNKKIIRKKNYRFKNRFYIRLFKNKYLKKMCFKFIKEKNYDIDVFYMRYMFFDLITLKGLKSLKKHNVKTIIEAHTYPIKPKKLSLTKIACIYDSIVTPYIKKYIDLVVAVCDVKSIWGRKTINIDNAIDLTNIEVKKKKNRSKNKINIISVSTEYNYHGYDRVVKGLYNYYKTNNEYEIYVKFVGSYLKSTIDLVNKCNLSKYIDFTGRLTGSELEKQYNWADIGLGDLGRHRVGALSGSCLKTKEYFAKGMPFLTSLKEPTYPDNYKYVLQLEPNDTPIDFNKIIDFYKAVNFDDAIIDMRKYAEKHFTWDIQLGEVINYINRNV